MIEAYIESPFPQIKVQFLQMSLPMPCEVDRVRIIAWNASGFKAQWQYLQAVPGRKLTDFRSSCDKLRSLNRVCLKGSV